MPRHLRSSRPFLAALVFLAAGCEQPEGEDDDTQTDDDSTPTHEEGCVTVDGVTPGYATIAEALAAAEDGAEVAVCAGTWEEALVLTRPVRLVAAQGAQVVAPVNEVPLTISGAGVVVEGLDLVSTRTAVVVQEGAEATLRGVTIDQPGQLGLVVAGAVVTLDGVAITGAPYGGADFTLGSTATITGSTFSDNGNFGLHVESSGLTLVDSTIQGTYGIDTGDGVDGGDAVMVETGTGTVVLDGLVARSNERVGFLAYTTTFEMRNSQVETTTYGIFAAEGGHSVIEDSSFSAIGYVGINLLDQEADIRRCTVALNPDTSVAGIAMGRDGMSAEVVGNSVSGSGQFGISIQLAVNGPDLYGFSGGSVVATDNSVEYATLYGIYVYGLDTLEYHRNAVTHVTWSGELSDGAYGDGFCHLLADVADGEGALQMQDNEARDCDVAGIFVAGSRFESSGTVIEGNKFLGFLYQDSSGTETGSSFTGNRIFAVQLYGATVAFKDCLFQANVPGTAPEYWDSKDTYISYPYGIYAYNSTLKVEDSAFVDNEYTGIAASQTDLTVERTSFTGQDDYGIQVSTSLSADGYPVHIEDSTFSENGFADVYAYSSDAAISGCEFTGEVGFAGVYGSSFTGTIEDSTFSGARTYSAYVYNGSGTGDVTIARNVMEGATSSAISGSGVSGVIADNDLTAGATVLSASLNGFDELRSLVVAENSVHGGTAGISLQASTVAGAGPAISVTGNQLAGVAGSAISVSMVGGALALDDNVVDACGSVGSSAVAITNYSGSATLSAGGNSVTASPGNALWVQNATVDIHDNLALSGSGADGIHLDAGVRGSVVGNVVSDNAAYGIGCYSADVVLDACENAMWGNQVADVGLVDAGCAITCTVTAP
ncbi:right-handed parallel beta-helix repeat-containing protein [Myxococcota bacterium]|nr:right-handed parallel beta-helix repeat-containing protein [Myxococcota bacterium]